MIRLKIGLIPVRKIPVNVNYRLYLAFICNHMLSKFNNESRKNSIDSSPKIEYTNDVLTFSKLFCPKYEIQEKHIIFKDKVSWFISSPIYDLILFCAQDLFDSKKIRVNNEEFNIVSLEIIKSDDYDHQDLYKIDYTSGARTETNNKDKLPEYYILDEEQKITENKTRYLISCL